MAINLLELEPQQISRDLRGKQVLLYGLPKAGKTTLASQIDKVLIASFEAGTNALHNVLVQPIVKWNDWKTVVRQLIKDKEKLKDKIAVIAIDTVDEAYKLCEKYMCNQAGVDTVKEIAAYGGGYKMVDDEFSSTFRELAFAGYGMFFISHSQEKTMKDSKGQEYNQIYPALANRPFNIINKMVDIIAYLRQVDVQDGEQIVQKRYLYFRGDNRFYAGSRFAHIAPRVELSYDNLVKAIYDAIDAEVAAKGGGTATEEANPYYKLDYDGLMQEASALWGQLSDRGLTEKAQEILEAEFGRKIKFSETTPADVEKISKVLFEIKEIL